MAILAERTCAIHLMVSRGFYSQADDVRQVYAFGSFHPVLALAQMCKPAAKDKKKNKKQNTHNEKQPQQM